VNPIYVSIGHRIDLDTAVRAVLRCSNRFPIGAGLGIYTFWVPLNDKTAALFDSQ
jgi:hypothetical protein